jgi:hypothetical protein
MVVTATFEVLPAGLSCPYFALRRDGRAWREGCLAGRNLAAGVACAVRKAQGFQRDEACGELRDLLLEHAINLIFSGCGTQIEQIVFVLVLF